MDDIQFNSANFRINTLADTNVAGSCQFLYKGYIISASSVFRNPDVAVFVGDEPVANLRSIEAAIAWCDEDATK